MTMPEKRWSSALQPGEALLVADVGGTNCTFAFVREKQGKISLLAGLQVESKTITDFSSTVKEVVEWGKRKYGLVVQQFCAAGAGPVSPAGQSITITHLPWNIDADKIKKATGLSVLLINDFDAVAYGIEAVPQKDIMVVKAGKQVARAPRALLGPGTGLGKSFIIYNEHKKAYVPISSEGGHASASFETEEEFALARWIQKRDKTAVVAWEDVLSGKGISNLYQFLEEKSDRRNKEIQNSGYDPAVIAHHRHTDPLCQKTFDLFLRFYARCAKNLALDVLARGGVYLAGGITARNIDLFQRKVFKEEFIHTKNMKGVLEQIPVYAITNYDVSLYGAAVAVKLKERRWK